MTYRFASQKRSHENFASGRVLRSSPGYVGFPVRLAREMFEQCRAFQSDAARSEACVLYDPFCGAGHLVTTLGLLYGEAIRLIAASDVSEEAIEITRSNLALLTPDGLGGRIGDLRTMYELHRKASHAAALESARALLGRVGSPPVTTTSFRADARDHRSLSTHLGSSRPNVVIADLPYGRHSSWSDDNGHLVQPELATREAIEGLLEVVAEDCIFALAADRGEHIRHPDCERLRQFRIGSRRITWLRRRH